MTLRTDWGPEFFRRMYENPDTRVIEAGKLYREGLWLGFTLLDRLDLDLNNPVDLGSGTGQFADGFDDAGKSVYREPITLRRIDLYSADPKVECLDIRNVDLSHHDLIVCRDVLHYFEDSTTSALLMRMNNSGAKVLYLRITTSQDTRTPRSDTEITLRTVGWYRSRLTEYAALSCGIFVRRDCHVSLARCEWP